MTLIKVDTTKLECVRCEHEWQPRQKPDKNGYIDVRICPKCKSPYWDKERR